MHLVNETNDERNNTSPLLQNNEPKMTLEIGDSMQSHQGQDFIRSQAHSSGYGEVKNESLVKSLFIRENGGCVSLVEKNCEMAMFANTSETLASPLVHHDGCVISRHGDSNRDADVDLEQNGNNGDADLEQDGVNTLPDDDQSCALNVLSPSLATSIATTLSSYVPATSPHTALSPAKKCLVCDEEARGKFFGAVVCLPCKTFFIRCSTEGTSSFKCRRDGHCDVTGFNRSRCKACRYKRCIAVGMMRRERPERVEAADGQQLCAVCGDVANGVHFGVVSCEGCKKFFRRGLSESSSYECKHNRICVINPRRRNDCRYCRYQKCLQVGMSRIAIKMGRPRKYSTQSGSSHEDCNDFNLSDSESAEHDYLPSPSGNEQDSRSRSPVTYYPNYLVSTLNQKADFSQPLMVVEDGVVHDSVPIICHQTSEKCGIMLPEDPTQVKKDEKGFNLPIDKLIVENYHLFEQQQQYQQQKQQQQMQEEQQQQQKQQAPLLLPSTVPWQTSGQEMYRRATFSSYGNHPSGKQCRNYPFQHFQQHQQQMIQQQIIPSTTVIDQPLHQIQSQVISRLNDHIANNGSHSFVEMTATDEKLINMQNYWQIIDKAGPGEPGEEGRLLTHRILEAYYAFSYDFSRLHCEQLQGNKSVTEHPEQRILLQMVHVLNFVKSLPSFMKLCPKDSYNIARLAGMQVALLQAALGLYDDVTHTLQTSFLPADFPADHPLSQFRQAVLDFTRSLRRLKLDDTEAALLHSLLIFATDFPFLQEPEVIEAARSPLLRALLAHAKVKYGPNNRRVSEIFGYVPFLRQLGLWHFHLTFTMPASAI